MVTRAPDISERTIIDLSGRTNTYYDPTGNAFDCAIAGMPFIMAVTDSTPYRRQTAEFRSQRVDQLRDPGEHTLSGSGYWIRSQSSFHYGDGALFSEPLEGDMDEVKFRFRDSYGVDPWTPGQLSLLKKTTLVQPFRGRSILNTGATANGTQFLVATDAEAVISTTASTSAATGNTTISVASTANIVVGYAVKDGAAVAAGTTVSSIGTGTVTLSAALTTTLTSGTAITFSPVNVIYKITAAGSSTPLVSWASLDYGNVLATASDGTYLYVATDKYIYDIKLSDGTTHASYNYGALSGAAAELQYVKGRIIGAGQFTNGAYAAYELLFPSKGSGPSVEIKPTMTAADGTLINGSTNMPTGWKWDAIAEVSNAIYMGGYAGDNSSIYKLSVSETGALGTIVTTAVLPRGEVVYALYPYLGTYLLIGTNKGVRVGVSDQNGDLSYGPLVYVNSNGVHDFEGRDSFIWCTATNGVNTQSGTYRINLGQPLSLAGGTNQVSVGLYAKASDVFAATATGTVWSLRIFDTDRVAFSVNNSGVWIEHDTELVEQGQIRFPRIRFDTLENKAWKRFRVRTPQILDGEIDIYSIGETSDDLLTSIKEGTQGSNYDYDLASVLPDVSQDAAFKLVLLRNATDATKGPVVNGVSVKALPTPTRARVLQIPIFIYDKETDRNGNIVGFEGYARQRLNALEEIEAQGKTVIFQDFNASGDAGGAPVEVIIEQVTFTRSTPANRKYSGYGGVAQVIVRTIV